MKTAAELALELKEAALDGQRLRLGVDLDDVLSFYQAAERTFLRRNRRATFLDCQKTIFPELKPIEPAIPVMGHLATQRGLVIVTAREEEFGGISRIWTAEHFPAAFSEIVCVGEDGNKLEVCRELGLAALVDNQAWHVDEANRFGVLGVHLDTNLPEDGRVPFMATDEFLAISRHAHLPELFPIAIAA